MAINADILRTRFGFNDPNVIQGILNDPGQVARYEREYQGMLNPTPPASSGPSTEEITARQRAEGDAFFSALQARTAAQETVPAMAERIGGGLDLPTLRESAFGLMQAVKNIPSDVKGVAKQVGISAGNIAKRISSEYERLAPKAQEAIGQQQFAEQELGQRLGYELAGQEKDLRPFYEAGLPLLQQRQINEFTGYTNDKRNELDAYLARLNANTTLSVAEMTRATALATLEQTANNSKIQSIGGREWLITYNSQGDVINRVDLGRTSRTAGRPTLEDLAAGSGTA